jgi:hypothetical protein
MAGDRHDSKKVTALQPPLWVFEAKVITRYVLKSLRFFFEQVSAGKKGMDSKPAVKPFPSAGKITFLSKNLTA